MEDWIGLGFVVLLLAIGFLAGTIGQHAHYRSIRQREAQYRDILVFNEKRPPAGFAGQHFALVCGSTVMGCDYFRQFVASLKSLFGGRLGSFEAMLDRGRREAILRMKEEARRMGAKAIFNVRLETSTLTAKEGKRGLACVELVAYGTALGAEAAPIRCRQHVSTTSAPLSPPCRPPCSPCRKAWRILRTVWRRSHQSLYPLVHEPDTAFRHQPEPADERRAIPRFCNIGAAVLQKHGLC